MNKLKNIIYTIKRWYLKKQLTNNLGKVIEDDEKITCYVNKNNIRKEEYQYTIACFGIREDQKKLAEKYKLNKKICYIIEEINFKNNQVYIFGYNNCEVIIKNCNFELNLHINVNKKCTIDNINITTFSNLSINADNLTIKNINNNQIKVIGKKSNINIYSNDSINIIDSDINNKCKDITYSITATNTLNIINSKITGNKIECKAKNINGDEKSSLTATNSINLQANNYNSINIFAPDITINNKRAENENKSIILNQITLKKLELINTLKELKNKCKNINKEKTIEYENKLNEQTLKRILK